MPKLICSKIERRPVSNTTRTVEDVPFPILTTIKQYLAYYGSEPALVGALQRILWTDIRNKVRVQGVNDGMNLQQIEEKVLGYVETAEGHEYNLNVGKGRTVNPIKKAYRTLQDPNASPEMQAAAFKVVELDVKAKLKAKADAAAKQEK